MTDVACFCGCRFSFESVAAACPACGEVARVAPGPSLADGEISDGDRQPKRFPAELSEIITTETKENGAEVAIALAAFLR